MILLYIVLLFRQPRDNTLIWTENLLCHIQSLYLLSYIILIIRILITFLTITLSKKKFYLNIYIYIYKSHYVYTAAAVTHTHTARLIKLAKLWLQKKVNLRIHFIKKDSDYVGVIRTLNPKYQKFMTYPLVYNISN